ncbi:MAG: hypothetical protein Dasosvirus1_28 [Dasosvirus sp.]|uniref:Uncharacterized protein n=1 Tax=Dasosvirus sp. TaxID=2487764 RepID=A0A3G4ZUW1_9VIRU|nr:MAG: hypothetical protein Dasosvirus1_28 [Dasosvirus sp.]
MSQAIPEKKTTSSKMKLLVSSEITSMILGMDSSTEFSDAYDYKITVDPIGQSSCRVSLITYGDHTQENNATISSVIDEERKRYQKITDALALSKTALQVSTTKFQEELVATVCSKPSDDELFKESLDRNFGPQLSIGPENPKTNEKDEKDEKDELDGFLTEGKTKALLAVIAGDKMLCQQSETELKKIRDTTTITAEHISHEEHVFEMEIGDSVRVLGFMFVLYLEKPKEISVKQITHTEKVRIPVTFDESEGRHVVNTQNMYCDVFTLNLEGKYHLDRMMVKETSESFVTQSICCNQTSIGVRSEIKCLPYGTRTISKNENRIWPAQTYKKSELKLGDEVFAIRPNSPQKTYVSFRFERGYISVIGSEAHNFVAVQFGINDFENVSIMELWKKSDLPEDYRNHMETFDDEEDDEDEDEEDDEDEEEED